MINSTINSIIVETQSVLMSNSPKWETREEYVEYMNYEQEVANQIRTLTQTLETVLSDGGDVETLKRIAIQFVSNWS